MFINGLKIGLPQETLVEKKIHGVKIHRLSRKEKVFDEMVRKEHH